MICPRCLYEQQDADECAKCGIIIEKYKLANMQFDDSMEEPEIMLDPELLAKTQTVSRVSGTYKLLLFILVTLSLGYIAIVFLNDYLIRDNVVNKVNELLQTELKHDFHENLIAKRTAEICNENRLIVDEENITVEFVPDDYPIRAGVIYYTINVRIEYSRVLFHVDFPTELVIKLDESIKDDGSLKLINVKEKFEIY